MEIGPIKSKKEWDDFLLKAGGTFLQSTDWGDFKKKYQKVRKIEMREGGKIKGVCQFFEESSPFGSYFYIPHGPVSKEKEIRECLFSEVARIAKREKKIFVRAEPLQEIGIGKKSFSRVQPQKTVFSSIEKSSSEILKQFKSSTRYNVRYAQKKGVVVKRENNIDDFFNLLQKTKKRQSFNSYPKHYFQELLETNSCDLVLAVHKGEVVSGIILIYFGFTVNFLHSASDYDKRKLNAPAFLRFESIKIAKEKGCKYYDFWGIDEKRFPGVSSYKKSFGGKELVYPEGKDIPVRKTRYLVYKIIKMAKKVLQR